MRIPQYVLINLVAYFHFRANAKRVEWKEAKFLTIVMCVLSTHGPCVLLVLLEWLQFVAEYTLESAGNPTDICLQTQSYESGGFPKPNHLHKTKTKSKLRILTNTVVMNPVGASILKLVSISEFLTFINPNGQIEMKFFYMLVLCVEHDFIKRSFIFTTKFTSLKVLIKMWRVTFKQY